MIPRLFHWVWIGSSSLPEADTLWMRSWLHHNTAWSGILWGEHPESVRPVLKYLPRCEVRPLPPLVNQQFYDGIEEWVTGQAVLASRSDIVRYEVVARHGGIYLDTDVECLSPMGSLLDGARLCMADEWGPQQGNFLFGGIANHPTLWQAVRELGPHLQSLGGPVYAPEAAGPCFLGPRLRSHPDLVIFPHIMFNPLPVWHDGRQAERWPTATIANHHMDGKWIGRHKLKPPADPLLW